jgi:hypothetical protein
MLGARLIGRAHPGLVNYWEGPWCLGVQRNKHLLPYPLTVDTGTFGSPDSPMNFSRSALGDFLRAASLLLDQPVHRPDSPVRRRLVPNFSSPISLDLTRFLALRGID